MFGFLRPIWLVWPMQAEYISKAKRDGQCVQPGGCVEQDFVTVSVTETDIPSVPSALP